MKPAMRWFLVLLLCILFGVLSAPAQSDRGAITGTITDQGGGVMPGVSVVATNLATNQELRTVSTETGNYTISAIPAGIYSLTVEQPGFRKFVQTGITVQVAQTARIDVVLQVGTADNLITVSADAPLLKT